jgi:hypothetical protein
MSRLSRILTGATAGVAVLGIAAITAAPTFAAVGDVEAWHKVLVTAAQELELSGSTSTTVTLSPTPSGSAVSAVAGALNVDANINWKLQWQAVTGDLAAASTTGAAGTNLGATGFAATGGYSYAGANTAATTGNTWGAVFTNGGTETVSGTPAALSATLSTVYTGVPTNSNTVTATYSAHTDGTVAAGSYYGVIYYVLSAQ